MMKNSIIVMTLTMLSRILGMIRTVCVTALLGVNSHTDAYFSAFKISNFFRQLLGEGALGNVFIPVYNTKKEINGETEAKVLIFSVINFLFLFLALMSLLMMLFSSSIIGLIVRGYDSQTKILASNLLKIMSFYLFFIGLAGTVSAILNNFSKFFMPAFMPIMFNLSIIISAITFHKRYGVYSLAIGVMIAGVLQLLVLLPQFFYLIREYKFKIVISDPYFKKIFILILPMLLGVFAKQINTIVDQYFGSLLASGTVSALENATRIYNLPLGVFAISISVVIFPTLSRKIEKRDIIGAKQEMERGINLLSFFIVPSFVVLVFYSQDVVKLLLGYGKLAENPEAIKMIYQSLLFYSLGLFFYSIIHLLSRGFYAMKNTRTPVYFSLLAIACNIIFDYMFVYKFLHSGLALATALASMINVIFLYTTFNARYIRLNSKKLGVFIIKMLVASGVAFLFSFYLQLAFIKFIVFIFVYFAIWAPSLYKKKVDFFV